MNTKMLMLGILLLAGLSFAAYPIECRWASMMNQKYYCSFETSYSGWSYEYGYYTLAQYLAGGDDDYDQYLENMALYHHGTSPSDPSMWQGYNNMGPNVCAGGDPYYVPAAFRTYMAEYNSYNALFKREFNSFLRAYLANNPTDRSEVMGYLSNIQEDYRDCLSPS